MTNPLYFVETTSPRIRGPWFIELDRDSNSRAAVIELIRSGEVDPVKVLEIDEEAGSCRDVTDDIVSEALAQMEPDAPLSPGSALAARFDHAADLRKHWVA